MSPATDISVQSVPDSIRVGDFSLAVDWNAVAGKAGLVLLIFFLSWVAYGVVVA